MNYFHKYTFNLHFIYNCIFTKCTMHYCVLQLSSTLNPVHHFNSIYLNRYAWPSEGLVRRTNIQSQHCWDCYVANSSWNTKNTYCNVMMESIFFWHELCEKQQWFCTQNPNADLRKWIYCCKKLLAFSLEIRFTYSKAQKTQRLGSQLLSSKRRRK